MQFANADCVCDNTFHGANVYYANLQISSVSLNYIMLYIGKNDSKLFGMWCGFRIASL